MRKKRERKSNLFVVVVVGGGGGGGGVGGGGGELKKGFGVFFEDFDNYCFEVFIFSRSDNNTISFGESGDRIHRKKGKREKKKEGGGEEREREATKEVNKTTA